MLIYNLIKFKSLKIRIKPPSKLTIDEKWTNIIMLSGQTWNL